MVSSEFTAAADATKKFTVKPSDSDLLKLYGLFKQATQNPTFAEAKQPGYLDFKGKAKYNAWKEVSDKSPEQAEKEYIELVEQFKGTYKYDANATPVAVAS